jgi:hypothetical protein
MRMLRPESIQKISVIVPKARSFNLAFRESVIALQLWMYRN